ncbi:hypothetical protein TWF481_001094 [Arthrobotrys musiformis]|uniref:Uncharacterized protein n=1 Tax=Arthrobotrys musiformis TaxID=47236 RepID=A0AAV9WR86_9PEZI
MAPVTIRCPTPDCKIVTRTVHQTLSYSIAPNPTQFKKFTANPLALKMEYSGVVCASDATSTTLNGTPVTWYGGNSPLPMTTIFA